MNLRRGRSTALHDLIGGPSGLLGRRAGFLATSGNIEDVQLAAGGWLNGVLNGGIMGDVVSIHDVLEGLVMVNDHERRGQAHIVPVAAAELKHGGLEAELANP